MKEIFVALAGYEGQYEISSLRRIRSLRRTVKLRDKYTRTVSEKYLFTDKYTVGLGKGFGKGGKNESIVPLMIKSFYGHLDPEEYDFVCTAPADTATLEDIEVIHKEYKWHEYELA